MVSSEHYDVIIIGSGPGGGTMAWRLARTGKRILLLERGDYLPRERGKLGWRKPSSRTRAIRPQTLGTTQKEKAFVPAFITLSVAIAKCTAAFYCAFVSADFDKRSDTRMASRPRGR